MEKLSFVLGVLSFLIALSSMPYSEAKVTKLHFFVQDVLRGPDQNEYKVAESNITSTSKALFGQVDVVDLPFTIGPKADSKILGRFQGTFALADLNVATFHMSVVFLFTSGKYNGSTLSMIGSNNLWQKIRKLPIVGGTGVFEMARGIATTSTYSFDRVVNRGTFEYSIIVIT